MKITVRKHTTDEIRSWLDLVDRLDEMEMPEIANEVLRVISDKARPIANDTQPVEKHTPIDLMV